MADIAAPTNTNGNNSLPTITSTERRQGECLGSIINGSYNVLKGSCAVVEKTSEIGFKTIGFVTVPHNGKLGVVSSLAGSAVGGALYNWGPAIMAQGIINGSVAAGAQWGVPASLCRLGAMAYMGAVGVPNLPSVAIVAGSFATTCVIIGVGNAIIDFSCWGKEKKAVETFAQLKEVDENLTNKACELADQTSIAEEKFYLSQKTSNDQMVVLAEKQVMAESETDPVRQAQLEGEVIELFKIVNQSTRQVSVDQEEYLQLSKLRKEAIELSSAAQFTLNQTRDFVDSNLASEFANHATFPSFKTSRVAAIAV